MGLEAATYIHQLDPNNPVGGADPKSQGDDHIKLTKSTLQNTFENIEGAVTASHTELNILDGATLSTAELNTLDGVTASAAEINQLDNVTLRDAVTLRTAFCRCEGGSGVNAAYANRNITSLTRTGAGLYTIDHTAAGFTAPPNIQVCVQNGGLLKPVRVDTSTATSTSISIFNYSTILSDAVFYFLAIGP